MPELDLTGEDWENKFVPDVLGGLVLNQNSESMRSNQFLTLKGMLYENGDMIKDTGYKTFADIPSGVPGLFRKVFKHTTASGTVSNFAISNLSFYVLANSGANWHIVNINGGGSTTLDATASQTQKEMPVTATTNFDVGDRIAVRLDDGSDHVSTIDSISAGVSVTIADGLPSQALSGNVVVEGIKLAGTADKNVFALTIPWNDALAFTNGIDKPQYYDPATAKVQVIPNLPSSGNTICESLVLFDTSLLLLRTTEGGSNKNQRLRWSDKADFTEWVTGDAGSVDLLDSEDLVHQALVIGPYLAIYRAKSIYRGTAVNTSTKRFQWDRVVSGSGIMSPAGVVDIGDKHFVIGNKQTYLYRGGFDVTPVGQEVKSLLYGSSAELDIANLGKTCCVYVEEKNDVFILYQTTAGTEPDKTLRYSLDLNAWSSREFDDQIIGFGNATQSQSLTWNDLVGTWEDLTFTWTSTSISGDLNTILLCSDDGQVYEYDFLTADDNGVAQSWTIETPDFSHHNGSIRTDYLELKCAGGSATIEISIDEGNSWVTIETVSPGATPIKVRIYKQVSSRTVRYRIAGSSTFRLSWMNLRVTLETEN